MAYIDIMKVGILVRLSTRFMGVSGIVNVSFKLKEKIKDNKSAFI